MVVGRWITMGDIYDTFATKNFGGGSFLLLLFCGTGRNPKTRMRGDHA
jgi:hypothetical protein